MTFYAGATVRVATFDVPPKFAVITAEAFVLTEVVETLKVPDVFPASIFTVDATATDD